VTHFEGDSTTFNYSKNIKNKIDLVFIDGVHSYQGIYRDTNEIMKFTGYDETIVVWHDFRTGRNEIIENTVEAILDVLQEKYKFSFSFKQDPNEIYSYEVKIFPKFNSLEV
ncbi:hypothetical protein CHI02_09040, partial [Niallia circulans]|uniref:class I SAM-dependent methyltransferase n=1 Tax=Niallia circulans TaxID=1397 RepID=UPI000BC496BA